MLSFLARQASTSRAWWQLTHPRVSWQPSQSEETLKSGLVQLMSASGHFRPSLRAFACHLTSALPRKQPGRDCGRVCGGRSAFRLSAPPSYCADKRAPLESTLPARSAEAAMKVAPEV